MPTSIMDLAHAANLRFHGPVPWGSEAIPTDQDGPGVYVVTLASSLDDKEKCKYEYPPIAIDMLEDWLTNAPQLTLDGLPPSSQALSERLSQYWLTDECILYIGMTHDLI